MKTFTNLLARWLCTGLCAGLAFFSVTTAQAQNTWIGATDTIYTKPNNWSLRRVPSSTDNVLIPANGTSVTAANEDGTGTTIVTVTRQPSMSAALGIGTANSLTISTGARLRLGPQSELDLYGNLSNNGILTGAGALVTKGTVAHTLDGSGSPITINDLMIDTSAPATLLIPMRLSRLLSLVGNLTTTTTGTLTLLSTPSVTAFAVPAAVDNLGGVVVGSVTVQRAIDGSINTGLGYRHYSSPVSNTTVADFTTAGFTPEISQATTYNTSQNPPATRPFPTVYGYDQLRVMLTNTSSNFDKGFVVPTTLATPLIPGRGYAVNINAAQLVDFVGTLNNDVIAVSMSRNAAGTNNSSDAGWQFLGNPYPAPLDYSLVAPADRLGLDNTIYVYRSTGQYTGMYRAYTNGQGGNPVLPVGQAFFARLTTPGTSSTFTFRNSQRKITSDGTTFQRPAASDARPQMELTLNENSNDLAQDFLNVYFEGGSTAGVDAQYDAVKLPNTNGLNMSTLTADGQALAIDGRPAPTSQLTIPLQVFVPTTGSYTLKLNKLENMNGIHVYLHDIQQGTFTDFAQQTSYTFSLNAANTNQRFELVFAAQPLATMAPASLSQQVSLYPSPAKDAAFVELPASLGGQAVMATLLDGLGRNVRTSTLPARGASTHQLSLTGLSAGVYVLHLDTNAGVVIKRLIVE